MPRGDGIVDLDPLSVSKGGFLGRDDLTIFKCFFHPSGFELVGTKTAGRREDGEAGVRGGQAARPVVAVASRDGRQPVESWQTGEAPGAFRLKLEPSR